MSLFCVGFCEELVYCILVLFIGLVLRETGLQHYNSAVTIFST